LVVTSGFGAGASAKAAAVNNSVVAIPIVNNFMPNSSLSDPPMSIATRDPVAQIG
jgi:hypothetical protein